MLYQVNELLSLTRLAIAYWRDLNATKDYRDNPGKQLQSWIVATCLDKESVIIDPVIKPIIDELVMFDDNACLSADRNQIAIWLTHSLTLFEVDLKPVPRSRQKEETLLKIANLKKRVSEWFLSDGVSDATVARETFLDFREDYDALDAQVQTLWLPKRTV